MSEIVTHDPPPDANFVIRVDLAEHGMPGRSEQLWAKQIAQTRFILRSLPFFAYGLRPGDEIETDDEFSFQSVISPSGRHLLRVAVLRDQVDVVCSDLHALLERLGLSHEWHGVGYVAVDLPSAEIPVDLLATLEASASEGKLHFELL